MEKDRNTTCRTCAFCDWRRMYCTAKDSDMSMGYMTTQKTCVDYERKEG